MRLAAWISLMRWVAAPAGSNWFCRLLNQSSASCRYILYKASGKKTPFLFTRSPAEFYWSHLYFFKGVHYLLLSHSPCCAPNAAAASEDQSKESVALPETFCSIWTKQLWVGLCQPLIRVSAVWMATWGTRPAAAQSPQNFTLKSLTL